MEQNPLDVRLRLGEASRPDRAQGKSHPKPDEPEEA